MRRIFTKLMGKAINLSFATLLILGVHQSSAQTTAFPGAEGAGRMAVGGRHGQVYIVTNLNDSGPGSFRDAVSQPNRIVVFEVGGVIQTNSRIIVAKNVTIAGQTAPGDGVVIYGDGITFTQASNSIVRYLRVRMGRYGTSGADAMTMTDNAKNLIFDHVSASWGRDETFSITGHADCITIQNSIISQGLETHSCGGLMEPSGLVSLFRNLYIDNNTRNPKVKNRNQFVNNVVYNWGRGGGYIMGGSTADSRVNIVNNYYIDGPSTSIRPFSRGTATFIPYVEGNYHDGNLNGALDGDLVALADYEGITTFAEAPYDYPFPAAVMTAQESYAYVLENAGANYPRRDQVDEFLMEELASLGVKGKLISNERELPMGGPGEVFGAPAKADTDRDGMPDEWETAHGLDPADASDAMEIAPDGYANIEHYINGLMDQDPADFLKPVTALSASEITSSSISLQWTNNDTQYEGIVLEVSQQGGAFIPQDTVAGNEAGYILEGLLPNVSYQLRLTPYHESLEAISTISPIWKTLPVPTAPSTPGDASPMDGHSFADTTSLQLAWSGSENTAYYLLYMGEDRDNLQQVDSVTVSSYELSGLASSSTYYWRVDAGNELGLTEGEVWTFETRPYIPAGLVGAWLMEASEGTVVADSSKFGNDGEVNELNDYSWTEGKVGNALDFSTAENPSHVFIPHADQLYFDQYSFSISMWLKASNPASQSYLIHKGTFSANENTGGTGQWYGIEIKDGNLRFAVDDNRTKTELSTSADPIYSGEWVHLVAIRDREADVLRIYINGQQISQTTDRTEESIGQLEPIILGNSNGFGTPFRGNIDEVRLFNKRLSGQEVLELYHTLSTPLKPFAPSVEEGAVLEGFRDSVKVSWQGEVNTTSYRIYLGTHPDSLALLGSTGVEAAEADLIGLRALTNYFWRVDALGPEGVTAGDVWSFRAAAPAGLVGYWKMDEPTSQVVKDHTVYGSDGMAAGFGGTDRVAGKFGQAFAFDSPTSTASIQVAHDDHLLFDQTSFTLSMWVKIPEDTYRYSEGKDCYLIHKGSFADNWYGIQLRDGSLTFAIDDDRTKTSVSTSVGSSSSHPIFTNEWVHIVAIRNREDSRISLYINGEKTGETSYSTDKIGRNSPLLLGNSPENKPFRDQMDDVRLYNYALDVEEVTALYEATPKLELLYKKGHGGASSSNQLLPIMEIRNSDTLAIDLGDVTARYWFTAENKNDVQTRMDYAALGNDQVAMEYMELETPREGAFGYVAYRFLPGNELAANATSGTIQSAIFDEDWSEMDESNDYSAMASTTLVPNPRITLYYKNSLIWGTEPQEVAIQQKAVLLAKSTQANDNTIKKSFDLLNTGNVPLDFGGLSIRYWFTKDGGGQLKAWKDYAVIGKEDITTSFMEVPEPSDQADHYLEVSFGEQLGELSPLSETGEIKIRITKTDWSDFSVENDYSHSVATDWSEQANIAVYYYGKLLFGNEPGSGNAEGANLRTGDVPSNAHGEENDLPMAVYPNPTNGKFTLELRLSAGQEVPVTIYDAKGIIKEAIMVDQEKSLVDISDYSAGIYFIRVQQSMQIKVQKIIKY